MGALWYYKKKVETGYSIIIIYKINHTTDSKNQKRVMKHIHLKDDWSLLIYILNKQGK